MSCPPIRAVPSVGCRIPHSIRITVVLPEPFGPRKPKIDPFPTVNEIWSTAVKVPKRFVSPFTSIIGSAIKKNLETTKVGSAFPQTARSRPATTRCPQRVPPFLPSCFPDLSSSFHSWKVNVRRHSGAQTIVVARQTNLHAEYLFDTVSDGLHIARRKFRLSTDLLDNAVEIGVRKRIHTDADVLAQLDQTQPRFRDVNAHPEMAGQEQCGGFAIRRQHIAHFYAEHFENGIRRRDDLHLRQLRIYICQLCTRLCNAHLSRCKILLLRFRRTVGALGVSSRDDSALQQILLTPRVIAQEYQLRFLRVCVVDSRVDLR